MEVIQIIPSLFDHSLSDDHNHKQTVTKKQAVFCAEYFATSPLFNWQDSNNGCEARADAACILLEHWGIPHFKCWLFSGLFLKKHIGGLKQNWNYHVAALLPVEEYDKIVFYVIDPSTAIGLQTIDDWALNITAYPHSYQVIKDASLYIFHEKKIKKNNWYKRNKQNQKWMIEGLAGINGLSPSGKAARVFNKNRIRNKGIQFQKMRRDLPAMPVA